MPYEKVGKNEPVCIADEVPFDIPDSWEWCRFGSLVANYDSKRRPVSKEQRKTVHGYYDYFGATGAIDKVDEYLFEGEYLMIGEDGGNFYTERDNSFIARGKFWANNHVHIVQPIQCDIEYLKHFLDSCNLPNMGLINGIAVPKLNQEHLNSILVPIPPLKEQLTIVKKLSAFLPLIHDYSVTHQSLNILNESFPDLLKKSILQESVQGKLVPQDPNDEPASVLLDRIRAEKKRLIKEGKIKKDKNESVIFRRDNSHYEKLGNIERCIDDEIPFEIPESWAYIRLSELVVKDIKRGKSPKYISNSNIKVFAQKCNTKAGYINLDLAKSLDESIVVKYPDSEYLLDNDIVINSTGTGTMGRVGIFKDSCNPNNYLVVPDSHVTTIRLIDVVNEKYIFYVLKQYQKWLEEQDEGSTNQKELRPDTIKNLLIPLPATKEQQRIVNSIEQALSLIS